MGKKEIKFVVFCNKLGAGKLDVPLGFVNSIGFLAAMWAVLALAAVAKHPEIAGSFAAAVLAVAALHFAITEAVIKHGLTRIFPKRKRPYEAYPEAVRPVGRRFSDSSFPSSHMATTVAMLYVIVAFYPSLLAAATALSLLMAFSRLHNGMHYPTDLAAGTALGLAYGWLAVYLVR